MNNEITMILSGVVISIENETFFQSLLREKLLKKEQPQGPQILVFLRKFTFTYNIPICIIDTRLSHW